MTPSIVVEGPRDEQLIRAVLQAFLHVECRFWTGGGRSSAVSLASTLLSHRGEAVVLVIDADTTNEDLVAEQRSNLRTLLKRAAPTESWCLVLMEPELEVVLVHDDEVAKRLFGRGLDEVEAALRGVAPKQAVDRLLASSKQDWNHLMDRIGSDPDLAASLARGPFLRDIVAFVERASRHAA